MIQIQSAEQFTKAAARAKAGDLFVRLTGIFRMYRVENRETGVTYTVNFFVRNGKRYGHCDCKAGVRNIACKHLTGALAIHIGVAAQRSH